MPRDGSGNYSLPSGNPVVTGTLISSGGWANPTMSDLATALTQSLSRDGQTTPTANLTMGNFRLTNMAAAVQPSDAATLLQVQTPFAAWPSIVGASRNAFMSVATVSATATFSADEVVMETVLGGAPYRIGSFSHAVNLSTTGVNGMDTGSAPVSGYVALYAIYNPTTLTSALLATNATAAVVSEVYGGANIPAGYTASALVSVWPTNASSQFVVGFQNGRSIKIANSVALNTMTATGAFVSLSLAAIVPRNAKSVSGTLSIAALATASVALSISASSSTQNIGLVTASAEAVPGQGYSTCFSDFDLLSVQTIFYESSTTGSGSYVAFISGFTF